MSEEAGAWVKGLITPERSAATVKKTWLNASKTVFQWALEQKHISRNPFICQSASKFDPRSASNFDPLERRVRAVALAPAELVGVAETARARVVG